MPWNPFPGIKTDNFGSSSFAGQYGFGPASQTFAPSSQSSLDPLSKKSSEHQNRSTDFNFSSPATSSYNNLAATVAATM